MDTQNSLYGWLNSVKVGDKLKVKSGRMVTRIVTVTKITKLHIITTGVIGDDKYKRTNGHLAGATPKHSLPTQLDGFAN